MTDRSARCPPRTIERALVETTHALQFVRDVYYARETPAPPLGRIYTATKQACDCDGCDPTP